MAGPLEPTETAAVVWVMEARPTDYNGLTQKKTQSISTWWANCAYWYAYPSAPVKVDPNDQLQVDRWLRIYGAVAEQVKNEAPPAYNASQPRWPLATPPFKWGSGGDYKARRPAKKSLPQTRFHCGVDLNADLGDPVLATESATVAAVDVGWESPTKCLLLHLDSGYTLLLGGLKKGSMPAVGTRVSQGQQVGTITAYPKGDTMLHVQMYEGHLSKSQVQARMAWYVGDAGPPAGLVNPREYLEAAMANTPLNPANAAMASFGEAVNEAMYEAEVVEGTPAGGDEGAVGESCTSGTCGTGGGATPPPASGGTTWGAVALGGLALGGLAYAATRR